MTLDDFKKLFALAPERFPSMLAENYPRILNQILKNWDSPSEQERYFQDLVVDLRGNRQGFPPKAMEEILFLTEVYARWRSDRRRKADEKKLKEISPKLLLDIDREQKPVTPEMLKLFTQAKTLLSRDDPKLMDFLTENAIGPNQRDADGQTLLMHAAIQNAEKSLLGLFRLNANPHVIDGTGNTALHWAVVSNRLRITEILLYFGANPDTKNKGGATPLSLAAIKADSSILRRLLDYNADVLSFDNQGNFPLHKAVSAKAKDAVAVLVTAGASWTGRNKDGVSPQDLAEKDPEMKMLFEKMRREAAMRGVK